MKISQNGIKPSREAVRSAKPATVPLPLFMVAELPGTIEGFSLDGRIWSVITTEGVRKVLLLNEDNGTILDEVEVRTEWYGGIPYTLWGRGVNWLLFSNQVITHNGLALSSHPLQEEYPLDERRYAAPADGNPIGGRTDLYNQVIAKFDWYATHLTPFLWRDTDYVPPPCIRLLKGDGGTLLLGKWLLHEDRVFRITGRTLSTRFPQSSSWVLAHENFFLPEEGELSVIGGKLYGSAYRWMGRAFLLPIDFSADGSPYSTYALLVTNSFGINFGAMETTIGTETGEAVIAAEDIAFKRGYESLDSGPWRTGDGTDVVFNGHQVTLEDGVVSSAIGGTVVRVSETVLTEFDPGGETIKALGGFRYWMNPSGAGGGGIAGLVVGPSRDMMVYTDEKSFNRFTATISGGGSVLPRQAGEYVVLDSYCSVGNQLYRSRIVRKGTVTGDITPDWGEIIKAPVNISLPLTLEGLQWDLSSAPLIFQTKSTGTPTGVYQYIKAEWGGLLTVPLKWITADGALIDDTFTHTLDDDEMIEFPVVDGGVVKARLYKEGVLDKDITLSIPTECAGMWSRPFASYDCKAAESVGIHCNFPRTQAKDFIHAPASAFKGNSLMGGRTGYLYFYHATTSQGFNLYDPFFVSIVQDMEGNAPTAYDPSPGLYVPNGGAWMKEYGSDPFVDAFGKTRYRKNVAVIVTWNGARVDAQGYRYWTKHRLAVARMVLDTEEIDLAAVAFAGRVNA